MLFFLVYTASALASGGKLFNTVFGIDYHTALFIGAAVILVYTFMGGFFAVCATDFVQGLLMLAAILAVPIIAWSYISGEFTDLLTQSGVNSVHYLSLTYNGDHPITVVEILSNLAWGLGYCGMPHILVRFMAVKNEKELKKSSVIAIVWVILSLGFAVLVGLVSDAWAGLGAAFGPLVVMSLFWKRTNLPGAIAGLVSGVATVIIWDYIPLVDGQTIGAATGLYSLLVGFFVSLIFILVVSLATKAPDQSILDEFEAYKNYKEKE